MNILSQLKQLRAAHNSRLNKNILYTISIKLKEKTSKLQKNRNKPFPKSWNERYWL